MSWDDEWAEMVRNASHGTSMRLAGADKDGNGWSGNLKSERAAWIMAGGGIGELRGDIRKALGTLEKTQEGLGSDGDTVDGVQSGAAQLEVYRSWKRYLEDVSGRCGTLRTQLEKAGDDHDVNDADVKKAFDGLDGRYKDTPAVGGQDQGR
ncbi:hypothetical protein ACGRHY_06825 [Streptomyces sp. HK10]|uniref:hypothetical protein n=1 Tax=Streptomyces sp. HK10 TaxID=3373255 RepID=UPI003748A5C7